MPRITGLIDFNGLPRFFFFEWQTAPRELHECFAAYVEGVVHVEAQSRIIRLKKRQRMRRDEHKG
jgi:hypothetical protein